jgi:hypothetical protein
MQDSVLSYALEKCGRPVGDALVPLIEEKRRFFDPELRISSFERGVR